MRLFCWYCSKSVTTELPDNAIFRAIAVCPECIEQGLDQQLNIGIHKLLINARELLHEACLQLIQDDHNFLPNRIDTFLDESANFLANYKAAEQYVQRTTPTVAPVCTCSKDDGIHEWNCAVEIARRSR